MLGNVSPIYRSTLDSIQLLAVTKSSVLQEYGPQHILGPVMKDVGVLEEVCISKQMHSCQLSLIDSDHLTFSYGYYTQLIIKLIN